MSERNQAEIMEGSLKGKILPASYIAIVMRVATDASGNSRVLKGEEDARPDEHVEGFIAEAGISSGFWDGRDERGRRTGGTIRCAHYRLLDPQPDLAVMRVGARWVGWVTQNETSLKALHQCLGRTDAGGAA